MNGSSSGGTVPNGGMASTGGTAPHRPADTGDRASGRDAPSESWRERRDRVGEYFDQRADRWVHLTSEAPVTGIRATVRNGRIRMRDILLSWLPEDLNGLRILDAGCGPGSFSFALAERGAHVVGVDLAPHLIDTARSRADTRWGPGTPPGTRGQHGPRPEFRTGDFLEMTGEWFDHVIVMDCFVHYPLADTLEALDRLARWAQRSVLFTVAPWTPLLALMHASGRLIPNSDRAPSIIPVRDRALSQAMSNGHAIEGWTLDRRDTVHSGFYISRAYELRTEADR